VVRRLLTGGTAIERTPSAISELQSTAPVDSGEHSSGWQIEQKVPGIGAGAFTKIGDSLISRIAGRRTHKGSVC